MNRMPSGVLGMGFTAGIILADYRRQLQGRRRMRAPPR